MNRLSDIYYTTESYLFPMVEEGIGEITGKMKEFLRILEVVRPSRFLTNALHWCGDAEDIKNFSRKLGHVPIIDINKRRSDAIPLSPAEKRRYCERSGVERTNSDLKDNYGAYHIRVKGHWNVLCHLMFSIIALTVKQLFNMLN